MRFTISLVALVMIAAVGCNKKASSKVPSNSGVTEVSTPAYYQPAPAPYQPAPYQAQPVQPVVYDSQPAPNNAAPVANGGNYTIKKGDTLYSIAKTRYGNGGQYTKIVQANPGLDPSKLKVGQSITIPQ